MINIFNDFFDKLLSKKLKVAVVGDSMVDQYFNTKVDRISPEFPIPVIKSKTVKPDLAIPGGAANVVYQFKNLNVDAYLVSLLDFESAKLFEKQYKLNTKYSYFLPITQGLRIPVKKRYYCNDHPLCRIDIEDDRFYLDEVRLRKSLQHLLDKFLVANIFDVVIYTDYDKGLFYFEDLTREFLKVNALKVVDPKNGPVTKWLGCDVFKPNASEASKLSNQTDYEEQIKYFEYKFSSKVPDIVITRDKNGVCGKSEKGIFSFPLDKVKVTSTIGAGDCFVTYFSLAKYLGFDLETSAMVGCKAGSLYVQGKHNSPLNVSDFFDKIIKPEFLANRNYKLAFTNGCFDILHNCHVDLLRFSKSKGDKLVVAVNTDESVKRNKGDSRPINNLETRMKMLASLEFVDYVVSFNEDTPYEVIKSIKPEILIKGGDYKASDVVGADLVDEVLIYPYVDGISTTNIIEKIKNVH